MSIDLRPLSPNTTQQTLDDILKDQAVRAEVIWTFLILLHFAALLPLNPLIIHFFVVLLSWAARKVQPMQDRLFYDGLSARLALDSSTGVRAI